MVRLEQEEKNELIRKGWLIKEKQLILADKDTHEITFFTINGNEVLYEKNNE